MQEVQLKSVVADVNQAIAELKYILEMIQEQQDMKYLGRYIGDVAGSLARLEDEIYCGKVV